MFTGKRIEIFLKVLIFLGLASLLIIIFSQKVQFTSSDLGRHLENGKVVWQDRQVLFSNFYSYTETGRPFINHHWLSGLIFYGIYLLGGFNLLSIFNIILALFIFGLVFTMARRAIGFYGAGFLALPPILLLSERVEIRPEIFSYLFIILTWMLIERTAADRRYRRLLWLLPLFVFWVNIHIYFFIGLALIGFKAAAEFLPPLFRKAAGEPRRFSGAWAAAKPWLRNLFYLSLACLINPNTWRGLSYPFSILQGYGYDIAENKSIFYLSSLMINYNFLIFKSLLALLAMSFLLLYLAAKKIDLFHLFLGFFFSGLALFASRNLALFGLVAFWLISQNLGRVLSFLEIRYPLVARLWPRINAYLASSLLLLIICSSFYLLRDYSQQGNFIRTAPGWGLSAGSDDSASFFQNNGLSGPIFNNYDLGSALIFWLYPREKVFVDNRPEAYGDRFFKEIYKPLQSDPAEWQKADAKYKFKAVYFAYTDSTPWAQEFLHSILSDNDWALVYFDRYTVILLNKKLTDPETVRKLSLDLWSLRSRLRLLAAQSDNRGKLQLASFAQLVDQPDLAAELYKEVIFNVPDNRQALASFAYLYADSQDAYSLRQSLVYFRRALQAGYELPGAYDQMGLVEWRLGEYQKAEAYWRSALRLDRHDASALSYLDQIKGLEKQGKLPLPK